jgi:hypothetical protein
MEFRTGSPADAEAIAGLIASFQSELTDNPSGAGAEEYLSSVSVQAEASTWPQNATGTFSLTRILNLPGSSPSGMASTFFTSLSSAHINAKALLGACGSKHCASCALLTARGALRSTQAFPPCRCIKPSALLQQGQYRVCMASRFCRCGVRHC